MRRASSWFSDTQVPFLPIVAVVSYGLTVLGGMAPTTIGPALSSLTLAALGAVLAIYTNGRVSPTVSQQRSGGRAQAIQRRYHALARASAGGLYLALLSGDLVAARHGLWDCLTLICPTPNEQALIAMIHRVLAAVAALLILVFAIQSRRLSAQRSLRVAASCSLGLMIVQIVVGMVQVHLARNTLSGALMFSGVTHLAFGAATWAALVIQATLALRLPLVAKLQTDAAIPQQPSAVLSLVKDYISLTKPGVISLLIFTTLAGMLITPAGLPSLRLIFWTMLGGWLMPAGAHALNCYFDRDIDVRMGRTGKRPLPSQRIPAWHALALGLALGALAFAILATFVNVLAALLALAGYFYYVVIYTLWLKRRSYNNIVIGGGAGAFPPLVGWAAVTGSLTLPSLFLFAIIFYWTPPHFWALALIRQKDYANAGVPMLPVVAGDKQTRWQIVLYSIMLICLTILPVSLGMLGLTYLIVALALGCLFLRYAIRLLRDGTTGAAWRLYKFSLLYLALLFSAMVVDRMLAQSL